MAVEEIGNDRIEIGGFDVRLSKDAPIATEVIDDEIHAGTIAGFVLKFPVLRLLGVEHAKNRLGPVARAKRRRSHREKVRPRRSCSEALPGRRGTSARRP